MENKTYTPSAEYLAKVKDAVDQIYEITHDTPYKGGLTVGTSTEFNRVVSELRKREVIQRYVEKGVAYWSWNPVAIAPTKELYKNVAETIWRKKRESLQKLLDSKEKRLKDAAPAPPSHIGDRLSDISTQTLWDELKRRGCVIENGKLVEKRVYS